MYAVDHRREAWRENWPAVQIRGRRRNRAPSACLYNEARFGYTHYPTVFDILQTENLNQKFGLKGAPGDTFNDGLDHGLARFTPSGYNEIGSRSFWPNSNYLENLQINDNLLWQRGNHTFKAGVEYRKSVIFRAAQRHRRGTITFNKVLTAEQPNVAASRTATGNGLADFLLGWASQTLVGNQLTEDTYAPYWGGYMQDDWKLSRRLTVNAGLRWELFPAPYFPYGAPIGSGGVSRYLTEFNAARDDPRYQTFQRASGPKDCGCTQDYHDFAPRLGLSYRLTGKTVVRAGAGLFYGEADYLSSESARFINQTPGFTEVTTTTNNIVPAAIVRNGLPAVQLPASAPVSGAGVDVSRDGYPTQYAAQWFFDLQRELPGDILFVAGYQAAKATHLFQSRNINNGGPHPAIPENQRRVRPQWNAVNLRDPGSNSSYNALVAKVEKRFSKGVTFIASYTWSHNIDQGNESLDENLSGRANQYDLTNERGNSGLDRRHNFVGSFTYELPLGRGRPAGRDWGRALDAALGGWQVGGILSMRTGTPFDVSYPGDTQNSGTANRGNRIGVGALDNPTIDKWFDELAFVAAAPGVYGNTGRNVLYGPGARNFDFILGKRFNLPWEGHSLQFRFESFNFTNTPAFDNPANGLRGQSTATINAADEPRRIQFALKYSF